MSQRYSKGGQFGFSKSSLQANRGLFIGIILFVALIAFEIFNFDTTQFALESLLGNVTFLSLKWATILAIAFCAIDFAGLNRLFTPEGSEKENREAWFLMGAWLLGATMNAVMTWWAVSVTLLNNNLGNEVLGREQLLRFVPIFVAVLVWLTRILFIGSLSIAGETIFSGNMNRHQIRSNRAKNQARPSGSGRKTATARIKAAPKQTYAPMVEESQVAELSKTPNTGSVPTRSTRVRQRPPVPNPGIHRRSSGMQAGSR